MGWFGLCVDYENKTFTRFSSPSGDGLVQRKIIMANTNLRNFGFSSPLWDGLVLLIGSCKNNKCSGFRPRLGMGWFKIVSIGYSEINDFRPRLGLVHEKNNNDNK